MRDGLHARVNASELRADAAQRQHGDLRTCGVRNSYRRDAENRQTENAAKTRPEQPHESLRLTGGILAAQVQRANLRRLVERHGVPMRIGPVRVRVYG